MFEARVIQLKGLHVYIIFFGFDAAVIFKLNIIRTINDSCSCHSMNYCLGVQYPCMP